MSCAAIMPSNSSLGPMPIKAATVALYYLSRLAGSECLSQSVWMAWLARMLFQWSDREPPISLRVPFRLSGSLVTTVVGFISAGVLLLVIGTWADLSVQAGTPFGTGHDALTTATAAWWCEIATAVLGRREASRSGGSLSKRPSVCASPLSVVP